MVQGSRVRRAPTHPGRGHEDPGDHHLGDGLLRRLRGLPQTVVVLVRDGNAVFQFPASSFPRRENVIVSYPGVLPLFRVGGHSHSGHSADALIHSDSQ